MMKKILVIDNGNSVCYDKTITNGNIPKGAFSENIKSYKLFFRTVLGMFPLMKAQPEQAEERDGNDIWCGEEGGSI